MLYPTLGKRLAIYKIAKAHHKKYGLTPLKEGFKNEMKSHGYLQHRCDEFGSLRSLNNVGDYPIENAVPMPRILGGGPAIYSIRRGVAEMNYRRTKDVEWLAAAITSSRDHGEGWWNHIRAVKNLYARLQASRSAGKMLKKNRLGD